MDIIKCELLMNLLMKGPSYGEPVSLDFDLAYRTILDNLDKCINDWSGKEKLPLACFSEWKTNFQESLESVVCDLKRRYKQTRKLASVKTQYLSYVQLIRDRSHISTLE